VKKLLIAIGFLNVLCTERPAWAQAQPAAAAASLNVEGIENCEAKYGETKEWRIALIIANSDYPEAPLERPRDDALAVRASLQEVSFCVILGFNLDRSKMEQAVKLYAETLARKPNGVGFFYYAGHAIQVDETNYMIPVKHGIVSADDVAAKAVSLNLLLGELERLRAPANIVILDACRDNPWRTRSWGKPRGLAVVHTNTSGFLFGFSTAPGKEAADNGIYASALAEQITQEGLEIQHAFVNVNKAVRRVTQGAQIPWIHQSLSERVYLRGKGEPLDQPFPWNTVTYVSLGVAGSAATVGTVFGLLANSTYADAERSCPSRTNCSEHAIDKRELAGRQANLSNVSFAVAVLGLAAAGTSYFLSPDEPSFTHGIQISSTAGKNQVGLELAGSF
jgi:hypothetical protein